MAVVAKETGNSENLDFNEEKAFLGVVESRIDAIIERINNRIAPLERKLSDWRSYDYDDSDRKRIAEYCALLVAPVSRFPYHPADKPFRCFRIARFAQSVSPCAPFLQSGCHATD